MVALRAGSAIAAVTAIIFAAAGCGDLPSVKSTGKQAALAACRQAATAIKDPSAREAAGRACSAGAVGDAGKAAKQAARKRCLQEAMKVVDPAARQQVRALCPGTG